MPLSKVNPLKYFFLLAEVRPGIIRKDLIMWEAITQKKSIIVLFYNNCLVYLFRFNVFFSTPSKKEVLSDETRTTSC